MKIYRIEIWRQIWEYWYDTNVRVWYAIEVDSDGNQVGETIDTGSGKEMLLCLIGAQASSDNRYRVGTLS